MELIAHSLCIANGAGDTGAKQNSASRRHGCSKAFKAYLIVIEDVSGEVWPGSSAASLTPGHPGHGRQGVHWEITGHPIDP